MVVHGFELRDDELAEIEHVGVFVCACCGDLIVGNDNDALFCSERCFVEYDEFCLKPKAG